MGAEFDYTFSNAKTTTQLIKDFKNYQSEAAYEDGNSYSGRLNMCPGLDVIKNRVFANRDEAEDYVEANVKKWENALAVRYTDNEGELRWFIGGLCSC